MSPSLKRFFKSFFHAYQGIKNGFDQRNMKVHGIVFMVVLSAGLVYQISTLEWVLIVMVSALVMATELINSSIEELANLIRDHHRLSYPATKAIRDMAAGAVLISALAATLVGLVIFLPKLGL